MIVDFRSTFGFSSDSGGRIFMKSRFILLVCFGLFLGFLVQPAWAFDFAGWDALLKKYVAPQTIAGVRLNAVNYQKLKGDPRYSKLIKDLRDYPLAGLSTKEERLSFWINAYNIMAVKMVLDHYPVDSIKDAGSIFRSVWKKPVGTVGGKTRTLNEIEHEILRTMGEPRIHVAIVCASVSCPDLRPEAYTAESLNRQLDDQMTGFLANPQKGLRADAGKRRLYLSSIFKWFEEDFESRGGVVKFLTPYAPDAVKSSLQSNSLSISYLDYNWGLNAQ